MKVTSWLNCCSCCSPASPASQHCFLRVKLLSGIEYARSHSACLGFTHSAAGLSPHVLLDQYILSCSQCVYLLTFKSNPWWHACTTQSHCIAAFFCVLWNTSSPCVGDDDFSQPVTGYSVMMTRLFLVWEIREAAHTRCVTGVCWAGQTNTISSWHCCLDYSSEVMLLCHLHPLLLFCGCSGDHR